ncbi:hypothetical protein GCM10011309_05840 [Litorimonas cladophorae]|uniref:Uncharacterized protein n=1 Tax=Litorimonas cladophorae TaxID=1220491 RepID=A0A918NAU8_9PROT|nr:hypothetical protein GCM10011309_05840 [Litorimonas cladophorae]
MSVSDITKKIFSIEPEGVTSNQEPNASDIIRPISVSPKGEKAVDQKSDIRSEKEAVKTEKVPDFVTRQAVHPLQTPPSSSAYPQVSASGTGWITWTLVGFSLLYVIGVNLLLVPPLLKESGTLFQYSGLAVLIMLPVILLLLLGTALKRLVKLNDESQNLARAADLLVSPETEALGRTQTLARGIQAEISKFNGQLKDTVTALQGVQTAVSLERQALDTAGLKLSERSEDVGRSLTLQRQALESISGTFDAHMGTLSAKIAETSSELQNVCVDAESRLTQAGARLSEATTNTETQISKGTDQIQGKILELGDVSRKLDDSGEALTSDLGSSAQQLIALEAKLAERITELDTLNSGTQTKIGDLQATVQEGNKLLNDLQEAANTRETELKSLYDRLSAQLKKSENDTLSTQGNTARVVEANLAQMRRDFGSMETELKSLQIKINRLRDSADATLQFTQEPSFLPSRLNLKPLDTDFPPVEPPHINTELAQKPEEIGETPFNLGMDLEIESPLSEISNFEPDVVTRPGQPSAPKKGFGRKSEKETNGWRWRDMLGGLERPDLEIERVSSQPLSPKNIADVDLPSVDIVSLLSTIKLSPSAFVDEGMVVDATQARINSGEAGIAAAVTKQLPDAVAHLRQHIFSDEQLAEDVKRFHSAFSKTIGNTPPSAPALRAALGSPDGRAYLLCTAALLG